MKNLKQIRGRYLMVLIAMCGMIASALGMLTNVSGIFFTPVAQDLGVDRTSVSLTLTISNLIFALAGMVAARFFNSKNFKPLLIAGSAVFALGTAGLSTANGLPMLYALNAIRGFAGGIVGNVVVTTVINQWFHAETGLITSVAMGFSGLIGALFNPILSAVIDNAGWRTGYIVTGCVIALLNLPAILLPIGFKPEDCGMTPLGDKSENSSAQGRTGHSESLSVFLLALIAIGLSSFVSAIPQHFPGIAETYSLKDTGTVMMSVVLAANTVGKLLFGAMTDRLGVKRSMLIYGTLIALGTLAVLFLRFPAAMLAAAALVGLCFSLPTVGAVMITRELFSPERYRQVFPKINLAATVANALGYPLLAAFYDASGVYDGALWLVFAATLLVMGGVVLAYRVADREATK